VTGVILQVCVHEISRRDREEFEPPVIRFGSAESIVPKLIYRDL